MIEEASHESKTAVAVDSTNVVKKQWKLKNFHELANYYENFYILIEQNQNDIGKYRLKKNYDESVQNICGTFKKRTASYMLNMFTFSANKNVERLRHNMFQLFFDYEGFGINKNDMNHEMMISTIHHWYPFTDEKTCFWLSASKLQNIFDMYESKKINREVCRACAMYFIKMNINGATPDSSEEDKSTDSLTAAAEPTENWDSIEARKTKLDFNVNKRERERERETIRKKKKQKKRESKRKSKGQGQKEEESEADSIGQD